MLKPISHQSPAACFYFSVQLPTPGLRPDAGTGACETKLPASPTTQADGRGASARSACQASPQGLCLTHPGAPTTMPGTHRLLSRSAWPKGRAQLRVGCWVSGFSVCRSFNDIQVDEPHEDEQSGNKSYFPSRHVHTHCCTPALACLLVLLLPYAFPAPSFALFTVGYNLTFSMRPLGAPPPLQWLSQSPPSPPIWR